MDGQSMNLDGLLASVMQNPEMLKSAMELAGKLSANGGLQSLFSSNDDRKDAFHKESPQEKENAWRSGEEHASQKEDSKGLGEKAMLPAQSSRNRHDLQRHRKLLEALCLYVNEEKRGKLELVIRLLDLMDFAGNMGL